MRFSYFTPESRELFTRPAVQHPPYTFNCLSYLLRRRSPLGAFKAHMLDEVAGACFFIAFVTGAYAYKDSYAYRPGGRHVAGNDAKAAFMNMLVVQSITPIFLLYTILLSIKAEADLKIIRRLLLRKLNSYS